MHSWTNWTKKGSNNQILPFLNKIKESEDEIFSSMLLMTIHHQKYVLANYIIYSSLPKYWLKVGKVTTVQKSWIMYRKAHLATNHWRGIVLSEFGQIDYNQGRREFQSKHLWEKMHTYFRQKQYLISKIDRKKTKILKLKEKLSLFVSWKCHAITEC